MVADTKAKKVKALIVYVSPADKATIERWARNRGKSKSKFLYQLMVYAVKHGALDV